MIQNDMIAGYVGTDPVEKIYLGSELVWTNTPPVPDYRTLPLTVEILTKIDDVPFTTSNSVGQVEYRRNGGEWKPTVYDPSTYSVGTERLDVGDIVEFRGTSAATSYRFSQNTGYTFKVYGNINSMYFPTDFAEHDEAGGKFNSAFESSLVTDASNLILPSDFSGLSGTCSQMFSYCTSLTTAPSILPATTLTELCYGSMFYGCTSLVAAPELPATTLAQSCYYHMFYGCTSLTATPELPATTLASSCYFNMFKSCTSLTTAPALPATTLAIGCYDSMFWGCTSLTAAPVLSATTLAGSCYESMFANCTSLTTAPELPATTLAQNCYSNMFAGCTSLTEGPVVSGTGPKTITLAPCLNMFEGCTALTAVTFLFPFDYSTDAWQMYIGYWHGNTTLPASGVFNKEPGADWGQPGEYWGEGVPAGWTIVNYTPPA